MSEEDGKTDSDENPFENLPSDLTYSVPKKKTTVAKKATAYEELPKDFEDYISTDAVSKSTLALASGLGFFIIAVILYFMLTAYYDTNTIIIIFLGLLFAVLISFFYLLDDLTIRPHWITSRGGHFISGMFLGALALLIILILNTYTDWLFIVPLFIIILLMNVCVSFFLYAMAWEE